MFIHTEPEQKQSAKSTVQKKKPEKKVEQNQTGIPDSMKSRFESLSGFSLDAVRVHYNSDKPARIQALAYTQGDQVYVAPKQERHLGHELGHVVQQKTKYIKPTLSYNEMPINDDVALEKEADSIGNIIKFKTDNPVSTILRPMKTESFNNNDVIQRNKILATTLGVAGALVGGGGGLLFGGILGAVVGGSLLGGVMAFTGAFLGNSPPVFKNKQEQNYDRERKIFQEKRKKDSSAFHISFKKDKKNFIKKVQEGVRFLWTYNIDNVLSIGSPENNQHSVVAEGKPVFSAGSGQAPISDAESTRMMIDTKKNQIVILRNELKEKERQLRVEKEEKKKQKTLYEIEVINENLVHINNTQLPDLYKDLASANTEQTSTKVELDLQSGHYAPSNKSIPKAKEAWDETGLIYEIKPWDKSAEAKAK